MLILGFTTKTSKILPHIVCRHFRHVAPIVVMNNGSMLLYQFVRRGHIARLQVSVRDIRLLQAADWRFIYLPITQQSPDFSRNARTCVDLAKRAIGMRAPHIQTPDALYKQLSYRA